MANPYFGDFGDVWKHLALVELLARARPQGYWETHAGSARYPLTHSGLRDYGVYHFLTHAAEQPPLLGSRYLAHLRRLPPADGGPAEYPGSAYLAMLELGASVDEYVFCDLDPDSQADLAAIARALGLGARTRTLLADGTATVWHLARTAPPPATGRIVVHIDPFDPLTPTSEGPLAIDTLELTVRLAGLGYRVVFWYAVERGKDPGWAWRARGSRLDAGWCGELVLRSVLESGIGQRPGLLGCGLMSANFAAEDYAALHALGSALAAIYSSAVLETGDSGALTFRAWP